MTTIKPRAQTLGHSVRIIKTSYFCTCFLYSKVKQSHERWSQKPSKLPEFYFSHLQNWNDSSCFAGFFNRLFNMYSFWGVCVSIIFYALLWGLGVGSHSWKKRLRINVITHWDKHFEKNWQEFLCWRVIGLLGKVSLGNGRDQRAEEWEGTNNDRRRASNSSTCESQCWHRIESQRPICTAPYRVVPRPLAVSTFCF